MMRESILSFHTQFAFEPRIEHATSLARHHRFIVSGMGGSNLASMLVSLTHPASSPTIHRGYGLPSMSIEELRAHLIIFSSYSGNTEEVIDGFHEAMRHHLPVFIIAQGGKLLELARHHRVPHIVIPSTNIQPRLSVGFQVKALLAAMGMREALGEVTTLAHTLRAGDTEGEGRTLAESLKDRIPLIYASGRNYGLAYNWKIKFNETAKIPAFMNTFPELNHNEMTGFDIIPRTETLSANVSFIFLEDPNDHPRIVKRMKVTKELYEARGFPVHTISVKGVSLWHRIMNTLLLADWTALGLSEIYGTEANAVPMVEDLKARI